MATQQTTTAGRLLVAPSVILLFLWLIVPLVMRHCDAPFALFVYAMPASISPYNVTALCAWTTGANNAAADAPAISVFFISRLLRVGSKRAQV